MSKEWIATQEAATAVGVLESVVRSRMESDKIECKKESSQVLAQADASPLCRRLAGDETVTV